MNKFPIESTLIGSRNEDCDENIDDDESLEEQLCHEAGVGVDSWLLDRTNEVPCCIYIHSSTLSSPTSAAASYSKIEPSEKGAK